MLRKEDLFSALNFQNANNILSLQNIMPQSKKGNWEFYIRKKVNCGDANVVFAFWSKDRGQKWVLLVLWEQLTLTVSITSKNSTILAVSSLQWCFTIFSHLWQCQHFGNIWPCNPSLIFIARIFVAFAKLKPNP